MAQALAVATTDFQCESNGQAHRTADFGSSRLIVRRGDRFTIIVYFAGRPYQQGEDQISIIVETGPTPSEKSGTKVQFPLSDSLDDAKWNASVVHSDGKEISMSICSPANANIGHHALKLLCTTQGQSTLLPLGEFILLFNPWCPGDAVFSDSEHQRREYVLNDQGLIYRGSRKFISHIAWNFGQFEDGILDICLKLLDNSSNCLRNPDEDGSQRHDPVYISRIVAAMVNCNDDNGVLEGNWGPDYSEGVCPTMWNGSITILRQWGKSSCQRIRYGQCWVFAAVACTVLRCLGIPTRPITNFNSAHDTEQNLRIDSFIDENGKRVRKSGDSVWNFHCWIESWMTRPDLKPGYDGWQVLDPTPQEKSNGIYCCGPASVKAIKSGDVNLKFDTPFVFAEVNADYVSWLLYKDGTKKQIEVNHRLVGQNISTKAVGSDEREDITHNYKYAEGSEEEREAFTKADMKNKLAEEPEKKFFLKLKVEKVNMNGADFEVSAVLTNQTSAMKNCRLILCAQTIMYNGESIQECSWNDLANVAIGPHEEKRETLQVLYSNYGSSLRENNQILIVALAMEYEAEELVVARKVITLQNPSLRIKILGEPVQYRKLIAEICFTNPMPVSLCDGTFLVEGAGLTDEQNVCCPVQSIAPGQEVKLRVNFTPQKSGLRKLTVDFDCNKLKDVKGFQNVIVRPMKR
ncbi:protein-glutamine gamma-glutamyltransferase 2-like [Scyliorhinus canicula]|uniref:protein-glutamine gamma-glutamyltransferase 2-like n=1 Tax=Scyliorhinus canicula TaxID=7830 RepID=UPI0018F43DA7|nr:protein-glutamine gamma-glutamyltransferase 2-like [Scyliorhinus canicula]